MRTNFYNRDFGKFLGGVACAAIRSAQPHHQGGDHTLASLQKKYLADDANNTVSDPAGGFLVPSDFTNALLARAWDFSRIASRCTELVVERGAIKAPLFRESSRAEGSRIGGVQAYWRVESEVITPSRPQFDQLELDPKGRCILIPVTNELLNNAPLAEETIFRAGAEELAVSIDDAIYSGTGVGMPTGVINDSSTIVVAKESGQSAATIAAENVVKMVQALWPYCEPSAAWFCSKSAQRYIYSSTALQPLLSFARPGNEPGNATATLAGFPLIPIEQAPALGTKGDLLLADFSQYALAKRGTPTMTASAHVRFIAHESMFKFVFEVDGHSMWRSPVTAMHEALDQSPFVTLEDRS